LKKSTKIVLITAAVCILAGISMLIYAAVRMTPEQWKQLSVGFNVYTDMDSHKLDGDYSESNEYSISPAGIDTLDIGWTSGAASVTVYDGSDIRVTEKSDFELSRQNALSWGTQNGKLYIRYAQGKINVNMPAKVLEVKIPAQLAEELRFVNIHTVSAEVYMQDLAADMVNISTTSGDVELLSLAAGAIEVDSTSGEISVSDSSFGDASLDTGSGQINAVRVAAGEMSFDSTSGDIAGEGAFGSINVETTSGDIALILTEEPREIEIDSTSGDIAITVPEDSGFTLEYSSGSGDFICDLPIVTRGQMRIYNNGGIEMEIDTTSGDLRIG